MDKQNLKDMVGRGELEPAFTAMLRDDKNQKSKAAYNALLIQYNQFKNLEQDKLEGVLSADEETRISNRILSALLSLIDDWPDVKQGDSSEAHPAPDLGKARWPVWLLVGAVALLGLIAGYFILDLFKPTKRTETLPAESAIPQEKPVATRTLNFPEGNAVTFIFSTGDEISYKLLKGELKNLGGDARELSFTIRCSARKGYGANFWDDTFRLELDEPEALLAPSSNLNLVVDNNSFKDGTVSFAVKAPFSNIKLAIVNPWDKEDIRKLAVTIQ